MPSTTDQQLISQCLEGNKDAFRLLVQTHQRRVFSLALKMVGDEEEAKDVVQETFLRVWQRLGDYDTQRSFTTWLYVITSRLCLDALRNKKRTAPLPADEQVLRHFASESATQRQLENREWVSIVRALADGLSPKQRLVFTLSQLEGLPSQEVEQVTGLSASQVKSNLYVARQTIRERLNRLGYE